MEIILAYYQPSKNVTHHMRPMPDWSPMLAWYKKTEFRDLKLVYLVRVKRKGFFKQFEEACKRKFP